VNYYTILSLLILGLIFFYVKMGWLGLIFILLAIVAGIYSPTRTGAKSAWEELEKAEGSYPAGKLKEYTTIAIREGVGIATQKNTEGLNTKEWVSKAPVASKSFLSELKDLFK
jgi:hypothetical protein